MTNSEDIRRAILGRKLISFCYENHDRIAEPHLLGRTAAGTIKVEAFQIGGTTSGGTGGLPAWRRFNISDMQKICVMEESFTPRKDFNPKSDVWSQVMCSAR